MKKDYPLPVKILFAALLLLTIYLGAVFCTDLTPFPKGLLNENSFAQKNFFTKAYMLLFTLLAMWIMHKIKGLSFGLGTGTNLNYAGYLKKGIIFGLLGLFCLIVLNILGFALTRKKLLGFPDERLIDRILFIWIWSSVVEEVLFRGLIQSYLGNFKQKLFIIRKAVISPAVFVSALFFGGLHFSLFKLDSNLFFVTGIVLNAFILGLIAGYYREKTGSIWPAVFIHIIFNVVGSLPLLLQQLLKH
ncbi:MAG: hypothetical protein COW65_19355 [Cytophagales bacterium CG18_big_fil_WC_8_21_14_2_50_42_9]|nr:MAG: hypothetical protein COW65_19355 [Cytophagales bacterium CG18_big_fil_WC_8_21_14_2_50_42_9]